MSKKPKTGILPSQELNTAIKSQFISSEQSINEDQVQPASLDLRLSKTAYRVRASFLPGAKATVKEKLENITMHKIDLTNGAVLEKGCVYIVPTPGKIKYTSGDFWDGKPKKLNRKT